jgi:hypothetical protein
MARREVAQGAWTVSCRRRAESLPPDDPVRGDLPPVGLRPDGLRRDDWRWGG